jgi:pimeloyl-ACP methyl ester carboxylesterase
MRERFGHAVSAGGTRIGWGVDGDGPPLVLVHGSIADRAGWAAVRDALTRRFTLHLVDRRGRGRGLGIEQARAPYSPAREAGDVLAVLDAVGPEALVLAHSYGGTCALEAVAAAAAMARLRVYEPAFGSAEGPVLPNAYRVDPVRLRAVTAPVRFLLGTESGPPLDRSTRTARAALPGSELRELRGHGHAATDADPGLFAAEGEDWLGR